MSSSGSLRESLQSLLARGDAGECVALAMREKPDEATVLWLLDQARGWHAQGLHDLQREVCELVLARVPDHFEALHLLGYDAQAQGDYARAEALYARAAKARPDFAFARLACAQMRMMQTSFAEGRDEYEARFEAVTEGSGGDWRGLPIARWRGEPLAGKKVYIWAEQGLGDVAMFAGFLPRLLQMNPARVALGMFPKLMTLFARSFPAIDVEPLDDVINHALGPSVLDALPMIEKLAGQGAVPFSIAPLQAASRYAQRHGLFDFALPMGDLMVHMMPDAAPARQGPYLAADPARVEAVKARLQKLGAGTRVGISWHTTNVRETTRNAPLEAWLPLLMTPGMHFISLQHHADSQDIARFCAAHGCHITVDTKTDPLADAEGLAALIASMDHVVTIDNANAHLAGALGVPTLLLLARGCNYRWPLLLQDKTLWYAGVSTLRQSELGDWPPVMQEAARRLAT